MPSHVLEVLRCMCCMSCLGCCIGNQRHGHLHDTISTILALSGSRHWVSRLVASMGLFELGMPPENHTLCKHKVGTYGKGVIARDYNLTHYIDDSVDCLWSVCCDPVGNAYETMAQSSGFMVHFSRSDVTIPRRYDRGIRDMIRATTSNWQEIASLFGLPTAAWDELASLGPPNRPFKMRPVANPVAPDDHPDSVYINVQGNRRRRRRSRRNRGRRLGGHGQKHRRGVQPVAGSHHRNNNATGFLRRRPRILRQRGCCHNPTSRSNRRSCHRLRNRPPIPCVPPLPTCGTLWATTGR